MRKRAKEIEDKIRKRNLSVNTEKEDILEDVMKLKDEIRDFQNKIREGELEAN